MVINCQFLWYFHFRHFNNEHVKFKIMSMFWLSSMNELLCDYLVFRSWSKTKQFDVFADLKLVKIHLCQCGSSVKLHLFNFSFFSLIYFCTFLVKMFDCIVVFAKGKCYQPELINWSANSQKVVCNAVVKTFSGVKLNNFTMLLLQILFRTNDVIYFEVFFKIFHLYFICTLTSLH